MYDEKILKIAYRLAHQESTDPSTQNAAILMQAGIIIGKGVNRFSDGVQETEDRWERPKKYLFVEHAERNAIYDAARNGYKVEGSTLYCPWFACADCARAIIQTGVKEVVGHDLQLHKDAAHWNESIQFAFQMFDEAGVKYRFIQCTLDETIRFNGQEIPV